jgi:dipeptidyl aminopeptidase/acylaminoacyl peptidase
MRHLFVASAIVLTLILAIACNGGEQEASPSPTQATETPAASPQPSPSPITATGKIAYIGDGVHLWLTNPDGSGQATIFEEAAVQSFEWSPDGSLIAIVHRPADDPAALTDVAVIDIEGSVVFRVEEASAPVWSPDGDRVALQRPHPNAPPGGYSRQEWPPRIEVYDRGGSVVQEIAEAVNPAWSPDGTELAVLQIPQKEGSPESGTTQGFPVLVDLETGDDRPLSPDIEEHALVYPVAWHPAGELIAYRDGVFDFETGEKVDLSGVPVFWSPNGRLLFMTFEFNPDYNATPGQLWDLEQGKPLIGLDIRDAETDEPPWLYIQRWTAWTPNGRFLMYLDPNPDRYLFRLYDTEEISQKRYPNIKGEAPSPAPDGMHAVFMDEGNIWVFVLAGTALEDIADGTFPAWQPQP